MNTNYVHIIMFEWDETKRQKNIEKHQLDFVDVVAVFDNPHVTIPSLYGGEETRFITTGQLDGRFVTIIYTHRRRKIRVISFRRARYDEKQKYQELHGGRA